MGHKLAMASGLAIVAVMLGFGTVTAQLRQPAPDNEESYDTAFAASSIGESETLIIGNSGSALASAAFGLSALQPETYNEEIVLDIIEASPLNVAEKERLTESLSAAEIGDADLNRVLADVRLSLAVE